MQVGTFRNARIIDVPLTVNVVSQEVLKAQAVSGIYDALRNTAGVSRAQLNGSTYDNVAVRGILVENRTSYRLNGSLPIINLVDLPIENMDRVEVLKGVGALYYGFAPPSGIINLVTKRPDSDLLNIELAGTNHGSLKGSVDFSRRLSDTFGIRADGSAAKIETGVQRVDGSRYMGSLAVDWKPADALTLRFDAEHVRKDISETSALQLLPAAQGLIPALPDPTLNFGGRDLRYDAFATNLLARADWRISPRWALTVEGGQAVTERDRDFSQLENYGGPIGNGTLRVFRTRDQRYRNRNARAELAGLVPTGPVTHNLIVGLTSNWRFQNGRNSTAVTVAQNFFDPVDASVAEPTIFTKAPLHIRDSGAYLVDRADFGPVELLAGLRYSDYQSRSTTAAGATTRFKLNKWTPSVGLIAKPTNQVRLYATYLEGLEEGGTAPLNNANGGDVLAPAVSKQYEIGLKAELLRGLVAQLAGFKIGRPFAFTDPADNVFKLAGRSRYRGIEASLTGEVRRELSLYATGQYLNAEVRRSNNAQLLGKRPENTPEWTASLFAEYRPEAVKGLALGAGAFYVGERAVNALNQAFVDGYTTYSASARYTFEKLTPHGLTLQLNADNLTNKRYWSTAGNNLLGVGLPPGQVDRPHRSVMRRILVTIHLWLGLIVGLVWAMQGLTGAALVFHREMDRWSITAPTSGPMASLDDIVTAAEAKSGAKVSSLGIADGRGDVLNAQFDSGGPRQLQFDASTARTLRERDFDPLTPFDGSAWRWVYLLHEALLLHDKGETLIGISGLLLFTTLLIGLWIGWPKRSQWRQAFSWGRWRSTRAKLFGWHRMAGILAGLLLVVTVPGGVWMAFAADLRPVLNRATDFQLPYKALPVASLGSVIGPQRALDSARKQFPDAAFVRITMPTLKSPAYVIRLRQPEELRAWSGVTSVTIDAVTGRTLAVYDAVNAPLANRITDAAFSIHSGEVAGISGRIAVMLAGISLCVLYITGVWSWMRRRRSRATLTPPRR